MALSGHHGRTLEALFAHPVSHNVEWHDVVSLLEHVGTVEEEHDGRFHVTVGSQSQTFDRPRHHSHSLDEQEVLDLRHMLSAAGVTP